MEQTAFVSLEKYRADLLDLHEQVRFYRTYCEAAHHQLKLAYYALCQKRYGLAEQHLEQALKLCESRPLSVSVLPSTKPDKFRSAADGVPLQFDFDLRSCK